MAILYLWKGQNKRLKWASALLILLFIAHAGHPVRQPEVGMGAQ